MKRARPDAGLSKEEAGLQAEKGRERGKEMKILFQISFLFSFFFFKPNSIRISSILFNLTKSEKF